MTILVVWLFIETLRDDAYDRYERQRGNRRNRCQYVRKELCIYATVSVLFALSYICRFALNEYFYGCGGSIVPYFGRYMIQYACYFLEGVSLGALMCGHAYFKYKSTRRDRPITRG